MKDIIINEGRTAKTFYGVNKIHTSDVNSGSISWIPEDEADSYAHTAVKNITENGTYPAILDGVVGYSSVTVNVTSGSGGSEQSVFLDSFQTNLLDYICEPNLIMNGNDIVWRDGETHSYTCGNRDEVRGLWILEDTSLVFKEQHLVAAVDYATLTDTHITALLINGKQLYFTEIIDGEHPYQNYTFTAPDVQSPSIAEMYKVYIRKTSTEYTKVNFIATETSGTFNIKMELGAGTGSGDVGKATIEKTANGLSMGYTSRTDDYFRGIEVTDSGTYIVEDDEKIGFKYVDTYPPQTVDQNVIYFTPVGGA